MKTLFNFIVCEKYHKSRTVPLYNTIGKIIKNKGDILSLVGSKQLDDIPILKIHEKDEYEDAKHKTLKSIIYHYDNKTEFDYFFMGDDDTYINFENFNLFLEKIKHIESLQIYGCIGFINHSPVLHATGGPGWLLSKKTFDVIAPHIKFNYILHHYGDAAVGLNVHDYNEKNTNQIKYVEVPEFFSPHNGIPDFNKIITFHMRNFKTHNELYENF